jgi:hypothetical protein
MWRRNFLRTRRLPYHVVLPDCRQDVLSVMIVKIRYQETTSDILLV